MSTDSNAPERRGAVGSGAETLPGNVSAERESRSPFEHDGTFGTRVGRRLVLIASVAVVAAAVLVAWLVTRQAKTPLAPTVAKVPPVAQPVRLTAEDSRRIGITFATAATEVLSVPVRTIAQVTFDETRVKIIAPKIDGWIDRLMVNQTGQVVAEGEPLLAIYSPALVSAQQELLLAIQLSRDVADGSDDVRRGADQLRESARRRLQYWDIGEGQIAALERTGVIQKTLVLRSPVSGVVVEKNVLGGQRTMAGEALFKIADLRNVWLEGEVFERDLSRVLPDAAVTLDFEAFAGEHRSGRISYIYPTLNTATRTARIRVVLSNPGLRLKPGMYATMHITGSSSARVVTVPRSAILATGGRSLVFVRDVNGTLEPRIVTLGISTETRTQIVAGITPGEVVVASATFLVDAESNLSSAVAGLGAMPGMQMGTPVNAKEPTAKVAPK